MRWKWGWRLHLPSPRPASSARPGPGRVGARPGLPSGLATLSPARGGTGPPPPPARTQGPENGSGPPRAFPPHHFSRGPGRRRACSSAGVVRRGRRGGRGGRLPHSPARPPWLPAGEGASRPRPPHPCTHPPPLVLEPPAAAPGRGALGAGAPRRRPARPRKGQRGGGAVFTPPSSPLPPRPAHPSLPSRPGCCLPACRAGPTAPGSEPWRSGRPLPGTGQPGRGDPRGRRGPRAARSPGAAGAAGQARVRLRRGRSESEATPAPAGPGPGGGLRSGQRAASPCTAPGRSCEGRGDSPRATATAAAAAWLEPGGLGPRALAA